MVQPEPHSPKDGNSEKNGRTPAGKSSGDQDLWRYLALGTQLAVTVGLFVGLGWWLDQKFGWSPWGLLVTATLGIGVAMYGFLKDAMR
jgi:F0F1-type ATP synthase assembly protein I